MARPKSQEPTDGELEILQILWDHGPCELGVVTKNLRAKRQVATTTVATRLGVMLKKELVTKERGEQGFLWGAILSRNKTAVGLVRKLLESTFEGSALGLVAHVLKSGNLTAADKSEIAQLLAEEDDSQGTKKRGSE